MPCVKDSDQWAFTTPSRPPQLIQAKSTQPSSALCWVFIQKFLKYVCISRIRWLLQAIKYDRIANTLATEGLASTENRQEEHTNDGMTSGKAVHSVKECVCVCQREGGGGIPAVTTSLASRGSFSVCYTCATTVVAWYRKIKKMCLHFLHKLSKLE